MLYELTAKIVLASRAFSGFLAGAASRAVRHASNCPANVTNCIIWGSNGRDAVHCGTIRDFD
jgi:hypothetical protein